MKPFLAIAAAVIILFGCSENNKRTAPDAKMVYGAPKATVTKTPDTGEQTGPLAYAPYVPELQDGDTVEVRIDVTHKMFTIKRDISFTAWLFGDSMPGPVLRVKVGQTVKFTMTDRSNDSSMSHMTVGGQMLKPMSHSIDFHSAMVNPEDKYRSVSLRHSYGSFAHDFRHGRNGDRRAEKWVSGQGRQRVCHRSE
jgi:nitrite reductase (NO-forming)